MIQRTFESACKSSADEVIVATDDRLILQAVEAFGGKAVMTSQNHTSGTERVAEVAEKIEARLIVNVQCDEPLIEPEMIDRVCEVLVQHEDAAMGTLASPVEEERDYLCSDVVKVEIDHDGYALTFSRAPIPYMREGFVPGSVLGHLGIYSYRRDFLLEYPNIVSSPYEILEKLEQLRVLDRGYKIAVGIVEGKILSVDTEDDLEKVRAIIKSGIDENV